MKIEKENLVKTYLPKNKKAPSKSYLTPLCHLKLDLRMTLRLSGAYPV